LLLCKVEAEGVGEGKDGVFKISLISEEKGEEIKMKAT